VSLVLVVQGFEERIVDQDVQEAPESVKDVTEYKRHYQDHPEKRHFLLFGKPEAHHPIQDHQGDHSRHENCKKVDYADQQIARLRQTTFWHFVSLALVLAGWKRLSEMPSALLDEAAADDVEWAVVAELLLSVGRNERPFQRRQNGGEWSS
jgi:hypothetical protein